MYLAYTQVIILKSSIKCKTGLNLDKSKIVITGKLDFRSQKDIPVNIVSDIYKQVYKIHKCIKLDNT